MLDGFIARRFRVISRLGAALDSVADTVFVLALAGILLPLVILPLFIWLWLAGIAVIKLTSLITGFFKYRSLAFLHTYTNKIAGITLFLCFLWLMVSGESMQQHLLEGAVRKVKWNE